MSENIELQSLRWTSDEWAKAIECDVPRRFSSSKPILTERLCAATQYPLMEKLPFGWREVFFLFMLGAMGFFSTISYFEIPLFF